MHLVQQSFAVSLDQVGLEPEFDDVDSPVMTVSGWSTSDRESNAPNADELLLAFGPHFELFSSEIVGRRHLVALYELMKQICGRHEGAICDKEVVNICVINCPHIRSSAPAPMPNL